MKAGNLMFKKVDGVTNVYDRGRDYQNIYIPVAIIDKMGNIEFNAPVSAEQIETIKKHIK